MGVVPLWAIKLGGAVILLAAILAGFAAWNAHEYNLGYNARDAKAKLDEATIRADALAQLSEATAEVGRQTAALQTALDSESAQRYKEKQDHEKAIADLRASARAGALRLSVDVAADSISKCAAPNGAGFTARPGEQTRAYLMPGITDDVLRIAGGISDLVRDYNAVVDAYNRARATCNGG